MSKESHAGVRKCAILLMQLDEETGAKVLKNFSPEEVQYISHEMSNLENISVDEMRSVLESFMMDAEQFAAVNVEASEHLRKILTISMGEEKARMIMDELVDDTQISGIDKLSMLEPSTIAEMIRDEHPQIIATILAHLEEGMQADVLELFESSLCNDITLRIATYSGVQPVALDELKATLTNMLDGQNLRRSKMGGVSAVAGILNSMSGAREEMVIEHIRQYNADLAQQILDEMFLFENLIDLDGTAITTILGEVDQNSLAIALKGAEPDLANKFIDQMSMRQAEMFKEDMESRGPLRVSQVETEQKAILLTIRQLANDGKIIIGGGDDQYV